MRIREIVMTTPICGHVKLTTEQEAILKNVHDFSDALWDAYVARQNAALTEAGILPFASHEADK